MDSLGNNPIFLIDDFEKKQYFVIRLKENRKVYRNHKWYKITTISISIWIRRDSNDVSK